MHTVTSRLLRRRSLWKEALLLLVAPLVWASCVITEVLQPRTAPAGSVISIKVSVQDDIADANPWNGVLSVMVPENWDVLSGTYGGDLGSGLMEIDEGWADSTERVRPADPGYKWVSLLSADAYAYSTVPIFVDAELQVQVGPTQGDFNLGYIVTKNAFKVDDILGLWSVGAADSLFNQPITITAGVAVEPGDEAPEAFALAQNYPNPFNPTTTIRYSVARPAQVALAVFDLQGRLLETLVEARQSAGVYSVPFDGSALASGTYLYRLTVDGRVVQTRALSLTK